MKNNKVFCVICKIIFDDEKYAIEHHKDINHKLIPGDPDEY